MWFLIVLFFILMSCKTIKNIEYIESPKDTGLNPNGTIKQADGKENARRMKYYNTLQHKSFYRHKRL